MDRQNHGRHIPRHDRRGNQIGSQDLDDYYEVGVERENERCVALVEEWARPDVIRLHAGELTAQEMRTAVALMRSLAVAMRS